jgi:predicted nucleic acid-binding protein
MLAVASLPIVVVERAHYARKLPEALRQIGSRDPEDVDLSGLALQFRIPVWSNDKDFMGANVEPFTTEGLLRHLGVID